jgi:hypothetical protein
VYCIKNGVKGLCHHIDIFLKVYNIFLHMRQWFFNILVGLLKKVLNTNIFLASFKIVKNSETCTESRIRIIPRLTISVIGQFPPVITSHWAGEKLVKICHGWSTEQFFRALASFYSNRRVSVCHNKIFEKRDWKDFKK